MIEDRTSEEYWNWRVQNHKDEERMIWYGDKWKWDSVELVSNHILSMFKGCSVLDLGCGYGRIANLFSPDKYLGIDFSEEMINLAKKKNPKHSFLVEDFNTYIPDKNFDIIVSVMSGENTDRLWDYASVATVIISPTETKIKFKDLS
jgi:SAM-dependent methyltransferase